MFSQRVKSERWMWGALLGGLFALGCEDAPLSTPQRGNTAGEAGEAGHDASVDGVGGWGTEGPQGRQYVVLLDSASAPTALVPDAQGDGGAASQPLGPPYGTSTNCGDGIVGEDEDGNPEECDDGQGGAPNEIDACTDECQTRDQPGSTVEPPPDETPDRYLGSGRHPIAGLEDQGFITSYLNVGGEDPAVGATLFNIWGQPEHHVTVSEGASPLYEANPVAAGLQNGAYAVAWTDFNGDGSDLGVALRRVSTDGVLGPLRSANETTEFSQLNPDMIWAGGELVVAWEDYSDAFSGPDLRIRSFDAELNPISSEITLADSDLPEAAVALTPFGGSWAAAYREGASNGGEHIVVVAAGQTFRVGPFIGGPIDDRPALVALDTEHLLVAFSTQTDPSLGGQYDVSRVRYAVVDVAGSLNPPSQSLDPVDDVFTRNVFNSQVSPSLAPGPTGSVYLSWRSEARPGDAAGDQLWLKSLTWSAAGTPQLEGRRAEMLLPRTCEGSTGDQRRPALARVGLPPHGALAVAWDDYSRAQGTGEPDVVVHYAPTHPQDIAEGSQFHEPFTAPDGPGWTSHWSSAAAIPALTASTVAETGRMAVATGTGAIVSWVNHHTARNTDLTVKVNYGAGGVQPGLVARLDPADNSYLVARFPNTSSVPWSIFGMVGSQLVPIVSGTKPTMFSVYAEIVAHYLRFRVADNPDGSVFVGAKTWVVGTEEPATWQMEANLPIVGTGELADLGRSMSNRAGHFGLYANFMASSRHVSYDDFKASFFEGDHEGNLDASIGPILPLRRGAATYRTCTSDAQCVLAEGCCDDTSECEPGLVCSRPEGASLGFGSHAKTCSVDHCSNRKRDYDEFRADCGGADCAPCDTCISTKEPGQAGFCSPTCRGGVGDVDCATHADCLPDLLCGHSRAPMFGFAPGADVCLANHCYDFIQSGDETGKDCGGSCGSCDCAVMPGCHAWCPCDVGEGDCDYKAHCAEGLSCGSGVSFGQPFNVCVPDQCVNSIKDTASGETSVDLGGPCSAATGITLAEAMVDFPPLQYRQVTYGIETADHIALPTPTPLSGTVTTPVMKNTNRFIFNVAVTGDVSMTFNVGNVSAPGNPAIDLKLYNAAGGTLKTVVLPSTTGSTVSTTVLLGRLGAGNNYELDLAPRDPGLTYTFSRTANIALALRHGADMTGPETPLYTFVPAEVDTAFLLGNFDPATPVRFFDPADNEVLPIEVSDKVYGLNTHGKPGVWKAIFRTSSVRAHWVNLPDLFSFDKSSVIAPKIIRTGFDYGTPPTAAVSTHYLRGTNRFVFHLPQTMTPTFTMAVEDSNLNLAPLVLWLQRLDGSHLPGSPFSLPVATHQVSPGELPAGDYELFVASHPGTTRYMLTVPAGVPFVSVDGFNSGNVWLASYRDYFYVPAGTTSVRFASSTPTSIIKIYDGTGALVTGQPVALGNGVFEVATPTPGTWAMNLQGATHIRFLNRPQALGFSSTIQSSLLPSPPYACTVSADCPVDQVCGTNNGARFDRPANDDLCWPASCSSPPAGYCGSILSPCGTCP